MSYNKIVEGTPGDEKFFLGNEAIARGAIESGIDPKFVSEKVIEAISNDIFYIITHPEYLPLIEARANGIKDDILALNKEPVKNLDEIFKNNEITDFKYENPSFSVSYPKNWTQIPLPPNIPVKYFFVSSELVILESSFPSIFNKPLGAGSPFNNKYPKLATNEGFLPFLVDQ